MPEFTLDHVELYVPDREQAAEWYGRLFGARRLPGTEKWTIDPRGPLMISPDGGRTKLALFIGEPQGGRPTAGFHRVAFRLGARDWLGFVARLDDFGLTEGDAPPRIMDHATAWSVYFTDPWGHHLEVTTYDHEEVRRARHALEHAD